jgi:hypothetical protein
MYLDPNLVATTIGISRKLASMSNNPPLSSVDEKYVGCSTSIGHSTFSSFYVALLSIVHLPQNQ